ncbi:unnamed protein product [Dovyalis caffra]|uniref:Nucleolar protein 10 n=1 Tax=Dovyalis caffra TaxID=77055 RepID=A0AAV1S4Z4_9ROSI|nr:unnamed protein product [Dovyalis caffra]
MYLQFYINDNGDKVYTTKKESPLGSPTESAHPVPSENESGLEDRREEGSDFYSHRIRRLTLIKIYTYVNVDVSVT